MDGRKYAEVANPLWKPPSKVAAGPLSAREEEYVTPLRVEGDEPGGAFFLFNLQMVSRAHCRGFAGEHEATLTFSDGGEVVLRGEDADRAVSALEDFAGYPRMDSP